MIEAFIEPKSSAPTDKLIDSSRRHTFNALHDLGERVGNIIPVVEQSEDEMDMVRHDNRHPHVNLRHVLIQRVTKGDRPSTRRKDPVILCCEGDEERAIGSDYVRQIASIEASEC
jgi:hypothetical protein